MNREQTNSWKQLSGCHKAQAGKLLLLLLGWFAASTTSLADAVVPAGDLFDLSLHDLSQIQLESASLSPQILADSPYSVSVITAEDISYLGARTLSDVFRHLPGMRVDITNRGKPVLAIRGIRRDTSDYVLILLDGHPLNEGASGSALFHTDQSRLPLRNIDRIEVVRGPGSAIHGANAFLSTVNIITRKEAQKTAEADICYEFDSNGTIGKDYNLHYGGDIADNVLLKLNLNHTDQPGQDVFVESDVAGRSGYADNRFEHTDFQGLIKHDRLRISARYNETDRGEFTGALNLLAPDTSYVNYDTLYTNLKYGFNWSPDMEGEFHTYFDKMGGTARLHIPGDVFPIGSPFSGIGKIQDLSMQGYKIGSNLKLTYRGLLDHRPTIGISYEYDRQENLKVSANYIDNLAPLPSMQDVTDLIPFGRDADRNSYAIFIEDLWQLSAGWRLNAGLRYDHYSDFGGSLNPRLGLKWQFTPDNSIRFTYGTAFRAPDFRSLYLITETLLGNPDLAEEKIETLELAFRSVLWKGVELGVTYFNNDMEDLIVGTSGKFENAQNARSRGLELEARLNLKQGPYLAMNYSYVKSRLGGDAYPDEPRHSASLIAGVPLNPDLDVSTNIYWQSESPRAPGDPRSQLESYSIMNINFFYRSFIDNLNFKFNLYNLFDTEYSLPSQRDGIPGDYPGRGRSFLFGLSYKH